MSEEKPKIVVSATGEVRQRVLSDHHFQFRDGDAANGLHAEYKRQALPRYREARLRAEYAHIYPCLMPNIWELAASVVDKVLAWRLQQRRGLVHRDLVLNPRHFELRGSLVAIGRSSPEQG